MKQSRQAMYGRRARAEEAAAAFPGELEAEIGEVLWTGVVGEPQESPRRQPAEVEAAEVRLHRKAHLLQEARLRRKAHLLRGVPEADSRILLHPLARLLRLPAVVVAHAAVGDRVTAEVAVMAVDGMVTGIFNAYRCIRGVS